MAVRKKTTNRKSVHQAKGGKPFEHPNFQRAVANGFVDYVPEPGKSNQVRWNWELIRQVWAVDNDHKTIRKFCDHWGIHYGRARQVLRADDKHKADETRKTIGRMILDSVSLPNQENIKSAGELIGLVLGDALDNIQAINLYVTNHLTNVHPETGRRTANIKLPASEVQKLALIQKRATDQLSRLLEVSDRVKDEQNIPHDSVLDVTEEDTPNQQTVLARITKGGTAEVVRAEGGEQ